MDKLPAAGGDALKNSTTLPANDPGSLALLHHASMHCLSMIDALRKVQEKWGETPAAAEKSFQVCVHYWKEFLQMAPLADVPETGIVLLLKHIKPLFVSEASYYKLLYSAGLFLPQEKKGQQAFWQQELERTSRFIRTHDLFFKYCREGATHRDTQYFNRQQCTMETFILEVHHWNPKLVPYDLLLAMLQAMNRYQPYILSRLDRLAAGR